MAKNNFGQMPGNMNNIIKQAQKMQKKMQEAQEDLETKLVEATAGGGMIKAVVDGKKVLKEIIIDKDVVDPDDVEMLQDMIVAVVNEAMKKAEEEVNKEMSKITGGINMPGGLF